MRTLFRGTLAVFVGLVALGGTAWMLRAQPTWERKFDCRWASFQRSDADGLWYLRADREYRQVAVYLDRRTGRTLHEWPYDSYTSLRFRADGAAVLTRYSDNSNDDASVRREYSILDPRTGGTKTAVVEDGPNHLHVDGHTLDRVFVRSGQLWFRREQLDSGTTILELRLGGKFVEPAKPGVERVFPSCTFSYCTRYVAILEHVAYAPRLGVPKIEVWDVAKKRLAKVLDFAAFIAGAPTEQPPTISFQPTGELTVRFASRLNGGLPFYRMIDFAIDERKEKGGTKFRVGPRPLADTHTVLGLVVADGETREAWLLQAQSKSGYAIVVRPLGSADAKPLSTPVNHDPSDVSFVPGREDLLVVSRGSTLPANSLARVAAHLPAAMRLDQPRQVYWRCDPRRNRWIEVASTDPIHYQYYFDRDWLIVQSPSDDYRTLTLTYWSLDPPNKLLYATVAGIAALLLTWRLLRRRTRRVTAAI